MVEFKINIGDPKTGKTVKKEVKDDATRPFIGKKVGDVIKGEVLDLTGYEFKITGGSDASGFPMRRDVAGTARKRVLIVSGVGTSKGRKGMRRRRNVAGNTIYQKTAQINLSVIKAGKQALIEEVIEEPKTEEAVPPKKEEKVEEKKEEPKKEDKPAEPESKE